MKLAQIVHNPTAGNENHTKEDLLNYLEKDGLEIKYVSTDDEGWEDFRQNDLDIVFVAGGDGTVHKLAATLLRSGERIKKVPVHLLPLGTANNIATTLDIPLDVANHKINTTGPTKSFDCGRIKGIDEQDFFLESVGVGIFPKLISEMEENHVETEAPAEKLQRTLQILLKIIRNFKAEKAEIVADGLTIKGSFLMLELMNIKYVGPNLELAPAADPGDGYLDLVLIPEESRPELEDFLSKMIKDKHQSLDIREFSKTIRAKNIEFRFYGGPLHVDDDLIPGDVAKGFTVAIEPAAFEFLEVKSSKG